MKCCIADGVVHRVIEIPASLKDNTITQLPWTGCGRPLPQPGNHVGGDSYCDENTVLTCMACMSLRGEGDLLRTEAKDRLFGTLYGMPNTQLMKYAAADADAMKKYTEYAKAQALRNGYVDTFKGRRKQFTR